MLSLLFFKEEKYLKIIFKGRLLLFDKTDLLKCHFPNECDLKTPVEVPVIAYDNLFAGLARISRDRRGLLAEMKYELLHR